LSRQQAAQVSVRPARLHEADDLAETAIAAWREGFRGIVPDAVDPAAAWRSDRIADRLRGYNQDGSEILAAEVDGEIRGLVLIGPHRTSEGLGREGEIIALYVHPSRWRQGAGRALVAAALDRLAEWGYAEAVVWTLAESSRNLAFYEALGFARDGATQRRPSFGSPLEYRFRISLGDR
jgi:GNAT superfamily N-acetyltransferase